MLASEVSTLRRTWTFGWPRTCTCANRGFFVQLRVSVPRL